MEEDFVECPRCGGRGVCLRSNEGGWFFDTSTNEKVFPQRGDPGDEFMCPPCSGRGEVLMTPIQQDDDSYVHPRHKEYWDSEEGRKHIKEQKKEKQRKKDLERVF